MEKPSNKPSSPPSGAEKVSRVAEVHFVHDIEIKRSGHNGLSRKLATLERKAEGEVVESTVIDYFWSTRQFRVVSKSRGAEHIFLVPIENVRQWTLADAVRDEA